jgi:hypothetical protein
LLLTLQCAYITQNNVTFIPLCWSLLEELENLTNVHGMSLDGDQMAFHLFFHKLLPAVMGRKVWTARDRAMKTISEAMKLVTVLDKAFLNNLALENYWPCWSSLHLLTRVSTLWTDNRSSNYQYMGWADAAYCRFDVLCHHNCEQCHNSVNRELEWIFLTNAARLEMAHGGEE